MKHDPATLQRLVRLVEVELDRLPKITTGDMDSYRMLREASAAACACLTRDHGGTFNVSREPAWINLGGIRASSTMGAFGALRNWHTAARRKLEGGEDRP